MLFENQFFWVIALAVYVFSVIFLTKKLYEYMIKKRIKKTVAVYYNRKIIHIFAGGIIVLTVPFVFISPIFPLLSGLVLTLIMLLAHRTGKVFYWFQNEDDLNDVSFCLMWAIAIFILWIVFDNPWIAVIPPAFIAFGDGITGIVRNLAFKERKKHPIGNIYMAGVCIPIGYFFGSLSGIEGLALWGVIAALVASLFERYEFGPIDDNVLITFSAIVILYIGGMIGPFI
jgi:hypothetical protein